MSIGEHTWSVKYFLKRINTNGYTINSDSYKLCVLGLEDTGISLDENNVIEVNENGEKVYLSAKESLDITVSQLENPCPAFKERIIATTQLVCGTTILKTPGKMTLSSPVHCEYLAELTLQGKTVTKVYFYFILFVCLFMTIIFKG